MYTLKVQGLDQDLRVVEFKGEEGISKLYRFDITVVCESHALAFADIVGRKAELAIEAVGGPRIIHGIVVRFEQGDEGKTYTIYELGLVPRQWRLRHRKDNRIFQELTTPEIVCEVLRRAGIGANAYRLDLQKSYSPRQYCVQYGESDWDFISRLLEEDGIHYSFEHTHDTHLLVISDKPLAHDPIAGDATLPFRPPSSGMLSRESVSRFRCSEEVRPGKVTLRDYDFKKPSFSLERGASADKDEDLEIYDFPGDYEATDAGDEIAKIRLEELRAVQRVGRGKSTCPRFVPGRTFELSDHGRADFNREYLLTRIEHRGACPSAEGGSGEPTYENHFELIPSNVPFRPARETPRPVMKGIQTAIVVGPAGEEIYTDEHGRVKVQFHWDRGGRRDERSSCWIRVSQIGAGVAWGSVFLPRIGHEVVVDFVEGDPDRPLIVGSVYHGTNVPPYPLPAERTRSTIKSNSSPGGGGSNELRFDDKKGSEEVYLHAEKDLTIEVENDKDQEIGGDETLSVSGDRTVKIDKNHTETIAIAQTTTVGAALTVTVGGAKTETVGAASNETVVGLKSTNVGLAYTMEAGLGINMAAGMGIAASAGMGIAASAGMGIAASAGEGISFTAGKDITVTAGGSHKEQAAMERTILAGQQLTITCGTAQVVITQAGGITIQGSDISVKSTGQITLDGPKVDVKATGAVTVQSAASVKIQGSTVDVN